MHVEIQVALTFVISYLYNKLPRRRVNLFGEELERALRAKFRGHWYPDRPSKGSAYRCLKTGSPVDPVLEVAARESGVPVRDVLEHLPRDLAVWIDPGEVSYRIGEKGAAKGLYSEAAETSMQATASSEAEAVEEEQDGEVCKTFNPEAQCFRPIDAVASSLGGLSLCSPLACAPSGSPPPTPPVVSAPASPVTPGFLPRPPAPPLTFTTATFAQTKFGSTKLKSSSKRANRMSPTEFSNYIKQRAIIQQQQRQVSPSQRPRSISPASGHPHAYFGAVAAAAAAAAAIAQAGNSQSHLHPGYGPFPPSYAPPHHHHHHGHHHKYYGERGGRPSPATPQGPPPAAPPSPPTPPSPSPSTSPSSGTAAQSDKQLLDSLGGFGLQYHHLLVAN
ncbi:hypothetical protein J437_LFUL018137 [Ladona fulva]|uniref:Anti-proliferative protein domain-containing protein n=1 Tax=Ladona fulva TaxID=123851 RepID=A0A8K0KTG7_LADFU|nr:hypothetical protein J437_LFUL018137 [Ladona fulva]